MNFNLCHTIFPPWFHSLNERTQGSHPALGNTVASKKSYINIIYLPGNPWCSLSEFHNRRSHIFNNKIIILSDKSSLPPTDGRSMTLPASATKTSPRHWNTNQHGMSALGPPLPILPWTQPLTVPPLKRCLYAPHAVILPGCSFSVSLSVEAARLGPSFSSSPSFNPAFSNESLCNESLFTAE